jgi:hypothetical protein
MNALAADQAGRFANEIFSRPELHVGAGNDRKALVKIGLYTGRSRSGDSGGEDPTSIKAMRAEGDTCFLPFHVARGYGLFAGTALRWLARAHLSKTCRLKALGNESGLRSARMRYATIQCEVNSIIHVVGAFVHPAEPRWHRTFLPAKFS